MFRHFIRLFPATIVALGLVYAQSPAFQVPSTGFVFTRASRAIYPVFGVPGSSYLGAPVLESVSSASIAPGGNWAYVTRSRKGVFLSGLQTENLSDVAISGLLEVADRIAWNRDGSAALLYSSSSYQLQRVLFGGSYPVADGTLDLSLFGGAHALAIDPAGTQIAFSSTNSGLYLFAAGKSPVLLSATLHASALAFDDTGQNLYAFDAAQQQIFKLNSGSGPIPFASLPQNSETAVDAIGLGVSSDGKYLMLADRNGRSVLVFDLSTENLANTIALDFTPTRFERLSNAPSYLLNGDRHRERLLILDGSAAPRVYFVPAGMEAGR